MPKGPPRERSERAEHRCRPRPTPDEGVRGSTKFLTAQYFAGKVLKTREPIWIKKKNLDLDAKSLDLLELSSRIPVWLALNLWVQRT